MFALLIAAVTLGAIMIGGVTRTLRQRRAWVPLGVITFGTGLLTFLYGIRLDDSPLGPGQHALLGFIGISVLLVAASLPDKKKPIPQT